MMILNKNADKAIERYQEANNALKRAVAEEATAIRDAKRATVRKNELTTERNAAREDMIKAIARAGDV